MNTNTTTKDAIEYLRARSEAIGTNLGVNSESTDLHVGGNAGTKQGRIDEEISHIVVSGTVGAEFKNTGRGPTQNDVHGATVTGKDEILARKTFGSAASNEEPNGAGFRENTDLLLDVLPSRNEQLFVTEGPGVRNDELGRVEFLFDDEEIMEAKR